MYDTMMNIAQHGYMEQTQSGSAGYFAWLLSVLLKAIYLLTVDLIWIIYALAVPKL
jgi:hypothetical protein